MVEEQRNSELEYQRVQQEAVSRFGAHGFRVGDQVFLKGKVGHYEYEGVGEILFFSTLDPYSHSKNFYAQIAMRESGKDRSGHEQITLEKIESKKVKMVLLKEDDDSQELADFVGEIHNAEEIKS